MKKGDIVNRENNLKCPNCSCDLEEIYQGNYYFSDEQGEIDAELSEYVCKNCNNVYQGEYLLDDENYLVLLNDRKIVKKKKLKKTIIVTVLILIVLIVGFNFINYSSDTNDYKNGSSTTQISFAKKFINGILVHYHAFEYDKTYQGYCECEVPENLENTFIKTYKDFNEFINQFGDVVVLSDSASDWVDVYEYIDEDFFSNHTLAIEVHDGSIYNNIYIVDSVIREGNTANININWESYRYGAKLPENVGFTFIILDKDIESVNFNITTIPKRNVEFENMAFKPVIYLYPSEETNVTVKLGYKENITVSYPDYKDGWNVLAKPNGRLVDLDTNRELYSLYYECKNAIKFDMTDEGFVVKGEEIVPFLEEKLEILGLTDIEAEEFIIYWLPILKENKYNYIRFATKEEINQNMPLSIDKSPDSIIRVLMVYKALEEEIEVSEQVLTSPIREGFTVVEWGVTEIK